MTLAADDTHVVIEKLTGLYQTDPLEFERLSRELIRKTIESFPEHHRKRAHGLQFKIDCILDRYHDPVARMNKMVEIFWEYFQQFHDAFHNPEKLLEDRREKSVAQSKVIPLFANQQPKARQA